MSISLLWWPQNFGSWGVEEDSHLNLLDSNKFKEKFLFAIVFSNSSERDFFDVFKCLKMKFILIFCTEQN